MSGFTSSSMPIFISRPIIHILSNVELRKNYSFVADIAVALQNIGTTNCMETLELIGIDVHYW